MGSPFYGGELKRTDAPALPDCAASAWQSIGQLPWIFFSHGFARIGADDMVFLFYLYLHSIRVHLWQIDYSSQKLVAPDKQGTKCIS
jgi:hypothetical protein